LLPGFPVVGYREKLGRRQKLIVLEQTKQADADLLYLQAKKRGEEFAGNMQVASQDLRFDFLDVICGLPCLCACFPSYE